MNRKMMMFIAFCMLMVAGCADEPPAGSTVTQNSMVLETVSTLSTPVCEEEIELSDDCNTDLICLRVQPTGIVTDGEDCRYYIPQEQTTWLDAYKDASTSRIPDEYWQPDDRSSGVWLRYQDEWWQFLENGDILTLSHERISANQCQALTALKEDALLSLGLPEPVRPEQIHDLCRATLEWNGVHTLTEPDKLSQLEQMLSSSQELPSGANCWFTALLTLEREDGSVLTLAMATDDCGTWLSEGVFYEYSQQGNEAFYALFGLLENPDQSQTEPTSPSAVQELDDDAFVRISDYIPNAILDLRYATKHNFTGEIVYSFTDAYLRYGTVKKLQAVGETLASQGYTLVIWDAFRPLSAQQALWDICPDPTYVSHPVTGKRNHCRGNAIDLTLADEQGNLLEMPSEFDDFTAKADRDYSDCSLEAAANAQLLQDTMEMHNFTGYEKEWWHFADNIDYPVEEIFEPVYLSQWQADCNEFITLRQKPSTGADAICRIPVGGEMTKLADCGSFAYVEYQGKTGYVLRSYLKPAEGGNPELGQSILESTLWEANCEEYINLRKSAGGIDVVAKIPDKGVMTLLGWFGRYAKVQYQGRTGYVLSSYIKPESLSSNPFPVVSLKDTYSHEQMVTDMETLCMKHPDKLRKNVIGYSELGREISALLLGNEDAAHHVLLQGAIHGREYLTSWLLMALAEYWSDQDTEIFNDVCIHIIPMVNPDGVTISQTKRLDNTQQDIYQWDMETGNTKLSLPAYAATWKANGLGVDINRNFPVGWDSLQSRKKPSSEKYAGDAPFSTAEASALRDYTQKYLFGATISYHASGSVIYWEYGSKKEVNLQSKELASRIQSVTGYSLQSSSGVDGGGYKDWCIEELGIPSVTIEVGCEEAPLHQREAYSILARNIEIVPLVSQYVKMADSIQN